MLNLMQEYWPFGLIILWFGHKWWSSRRVISLLPHLRQQNALFVDVRSPQEFASSHAPGTVNIPLPQFGQRINEIPQERPVVLCCASGTRSAMALRTLKKNGHKEIYNIGAWTNFLKI